MDTTGNSAHLFCNTLALEKGLDPVGTARAFDVAIALEMPLPWTRDILNDSALVPPELVQLVNGDPVHPRLAGLRVHPMFLAPDPAYSVPNYRRVLVYTRPGGAFANFDRAEYLVPHADTDALITALSAALDTAPNTAPGTAPGTPPRPAQFETYRADSATVRDIMICTHGTRDAACGKFGYPLYQTLHAATPNGDVRIWRVNHLGGHVFAPTLVDMPKGDYWGFADETTARQIIDRAGDIHALEQHYRGWAGLPEGFLQAAERAILLYEGWRWQTYYKQGTELACDPADKPQWADVRIDYRAPDGSAHGAYIAHVSVNQHVLTIPSTGKPATKAYPQYNVQHLQHIPYE